MKIMTIVDPPKQFEDKSHRNLATEIYHMLDYGKPLTCYNEKIKEFNELKLGQMTINEYTSKL